MTKKVLFLGRFQPFHLGHLSVIEALDKNPQIDEMIIAIGSSQESRTPKNPFSASERHKMIQKSLKVKKKFAIVELPDLGNHDLWIKEIKARVPVFDSVITDNTKAQEVFQSHGYKILPVKKELNISGTRIRQLIKEKGNWRPLVPRETAAIIEALTQHIVY